jgi:hypothetical protein
MPQITVTAAKLAELRRLPDWQLRNFGFDPESVRDAARPEDAAADTGPTFLNADDFTLDERNGRYVADASDLGLPPSLWPRAVAIRVHAREMVFRHKRDAFSADDLAGVLYECPESRRELLIIND